MVLSACLFGLLAQTVVLAGSLQDGLQIDSLAASATGMSFGRSSLIRAAAAAGFLLAVPFLRAGRRLWWIAGLTGALGCVSFAWMGHGGATKGALGLVHLAADVVHLLAGGIWVGALVAFLILLWTASRRPIEDQEALYQALFGFSGVGAALVAVLIATGLINSWFMIGLPGLFRLWSSLYGQLLTLKIALFVGMVGLAAANRFHLTPRLGAALQGQRSAHAAIVALRRSIALETALSIAVLALVAWFGMLAPPSAS